MKWTRSQCESPISVVAESACDSESEDEFLLYEDEPNDGPVSPQTNPENSRAYREKSGARSDLTCSDLDFIFGDFNFDETSCRQIKRTKRGTLESDVADFLGSPGAAWNQLVPVGEKVNSEAVIQSADFLGLAGAEEMPFSLGTLPRFKVSAIQWYNNETQ